MAKAWSYVSFKTEDAIEKAIIAFRDTYLTGITIFKTASMTELVTPRIQIKAEKASPERIGQTLTGNWMVSVVVEITTHHGDDSRATHCNRCGELDDILMADDLISPINNLMTDYKIHDYGFRPLDSNTYTTDGEIITTYSVDIYCCPSIPEN